MNAAVFLLLPLLGYSTACSPAPTFDWRTKGVISPVTNQGMIGSVLPIVLREGVESLFAIQNRSLVISLSTQEVVDCCISSSMIPKYKGYDCFVKIHGLCRAEFYKSTGKCNNDSCMGYGHVTKTGYIQPGDEEEMVRAIHQTPLTAYLDASRPSFQEYVGGVYEDPSCSKTQLDHAMQIVGYGTTSGVDYWILKNSWGVNWGMQGYMLMARGKNMCGIATNTYYPIG